MTNQAWVEFLQWALPQMQLRWQGFRRVRRQVCKQIQQRLQVLDLSDLHAYRHYLEHHPQEWAILEGCCRITISRFYRDRWVFDSLHQQVFPLLAHQVLKQNEAIVRIWSAGCASGEEAYTLNILWQLEIQPQFPPLSLQLLATEVNPHLLERATRGQYDASSLKELPPAYREQAFEHQEGQHYRIRPAFQVGINFLQQDIRTTLPDPSFHLILCRNLVFTYFGETLQQIVLSRLIQRLQPGGFLVLGKHESLPNDFPELSPHGKHLYQLQGESLIS